jgi:hypothetical protein
VTSPATRCAVGSDLIEAGLNEPVPRPSNGRSSRPMILDDRQAQTHAQLLRYGTVVAEWGKQVVDRICYQWVRRGRKVTPDNSDARSLITAFKECDGESRHGIVLWVCRDTVGHSCSTAWVYSFEVPPADGKKVVSTPTRATNSMPRQRLRSIRQQIDRKGQPRRAEILLGNSWREAAVVGFAY